MSNNLGVCCPECNSTRSKVTDSRDNSLGRKRRRRCLRCSCIYTTWEMTEATVHTFEIKEVYKALPEVEKAMAIVKNLIGDFGNE